jgi:hypothetical protein
MPSDHEVNASIETLRYAAKRSDWHAGNSAAFDSTNQRRRYLRGGCQVLLADALLEPDRSQRPTNAKVIHAQSVFRSA